MRWLGDEPDKERMMKRQATKAITPEVVDGPVSDDQQLIVVEGDKLRLFLGGLKAFFVKAGALELGAKERLDRARQLKAPTDADSDGKMQAFIRECKSDIATAEEHWSVSGVLFHLHRAVTTARGRTTGKDSKGNPIGMLDQAAAIAQVHHNRYAEAERRRAQQEQDRLRQDAEARAQADRDAELAALEAEAVKAEASSPELSEREEAFVDGRIQRGLGAAEAAHRAGFKNPSAAGERLTHMPKIVAALEAKQQAAVIREQAAAAATMPLQVEEVEKVQPRIVRTAGGFDRSTYSAEVYDADAFLAALLDPRTRTTLGIPADIATFSQPKLNDYAVSMKELINRWPGVRAVKKTTTV